MPSGVRVTIALIVIVFVVIGLYYASLESRNSPVPASTDDGLLRTTDADNPPETASSSSAADLGQEPTTVALGETIITPAPTGDDATQGGSVSDAVAELSSNSSENSNPESVTGTGTETETEIETGQGEVGVATTLAESGGVTTGPTNTEGTEKPEQRVSLGIPAIGSSVHLLADPFMSGVDAQAISEEFIESGSLNGPPGTAWVKIADWIKVPVGEPSPWITGERDGSTWVLVRDDSDGSVDLRGHVVAASERLDQLRSEPLVMFVLDDEATPKMRELTYPNIGHDFTVIIDREAVVVQIIRTAIEARATIAPLCDRESAKWMAARIRGDLVDRPGSATADSGATSESTSASSSAEHTGTTIQKTPPGAYETWVVADGETFSSIAKEWFGDSNKWTLIAKANPLADPDRLRVGQKLRLPPKNTELSVEVTEGVHVVSSGETLSDISLAYYGKAKYWKNIYDANRALIGDDPEVLETGMRLTMPKINP